MTYHPRIPEFVGAMIMIGALFSLGSCSGGGGDRAETPTQVPPSISELFVSSSSNDNVSVFDAETNGDVSPLRSFTSKGLNSPTGIAVDTVNGEVFVANSNNSVTVYGRTADGNAMQIRTIFGGLTRLDSPQDIAVDTKNDEILVLNLGSITVYRRAADGDVSPLRRLSLGSLSTGSGGLAIDPVNNEILVTSNTFDPSAGLFHGMISVYSRTADGDASPIRTISGVASGLLNPRGIAVDTVNNEIFVTNGPFEFPGNGMITVYSRTADGSPTPVRTISGSSTNLGDLSHIVVDTVNKEIFVTNFTEFVSDSVTVYARTADGNAPPVRTISGDSTGLSEPRGIAVDTANDEIFVGNYAASSIAVYARTSDGDRAPLRQVTPSFSDMSQPQAIAVDAVNGEVFVANDQRIDVYTKASNGNVAPVRTISGSLTGLLAIKGIAVDTVNREILVADSFFVTRVGEMSYLTVYSATSNGNVAPLRTLSGSDTGLTRTGGLAVDAVHGEIYVSNGNDSITVYPRTADGNTVPLRIISGTSTKLSAPTSVAIDIVNDELFVVNSGSDAITVYERTAEGDTAPLRVISGASTGLRSPQGVVVDSATNVIYVVNNQFDASSITVYSRTSNGAIPPLRTISGGATRLNGLSGIAGAAR